LLAAGLLLGCASAVWAQERSGERSVREQYGKDLAETAETAKPRAWLGVFLSDAVDGGVEVMALVPEGPAKRAGIREGDLILEVDGEPAPNQAALNLLIQAAGPGKAVALGLLRGTESLTLRVELGERSGLGVPLRARFPVPPEPAAPSPIPGRNRIQSRLPRSFYGLQVAEMTPALREHFGAPPDAGVLVLGVAEAEPAATLGFRVGDVLVQLGERAIRDEDQLRWTLRSWPADQPLTARFIRGGEPMFVEFEAAAMPAPPAPALTPELERELIQHRLQAEIERLEARIRTLREELEQLRRER
jgi:S1-C subfamily serine protease